MGQNTQKTHLDIKATQGSIKRAHYLMHVLIILFNKIGWNVKRDSKRHSKHDRTYITIDNEEIEFQIKEKVRQIPYVLTEAEKKERFYYHHKHDYIPTGELSLQLTQTFQDGIRKIWKDDVNSPLTDKLPEIIQNLILAADALKKQQLEREIQHKKWEEERIHAEQLRRLQKSDADRLDLLFETSERWDKIQKTNNFLHLVTKSINNGEITPTNEINSWINWANKKLAGLEFPEIIHEIADKHIKLGCNQSFY